MTKYGLSPSQCSKYDEALCKEYNALSELNKEYITQNDRAIKKKTITDRWLSDVAKIFVDDLSYNIWLRDNSKSNQIRRYREYLFITDDSILDSLKSIISNATQSIQRSNRRPISTPERTLLHKEIITARNLLLSNLFGESRSRELIQYLDLEDKAAFVRGHFTNSSWKESYDIGSVYLKFTYACRNVDWGEPCENKAEIKHNAYLKFLEEISSLLDEEQYAYWHNNHFKYHEDWLRNDAQMSPSQMELFKDIMNRRTAKRYIVSKSSLSPKEKDMRFQEIDNETFSIISRDISSHNMRKKFTIILLTLNLVNAFAQNQQNEWDFITTSHGVATFLVDGDNSTWLEPLSQQSSSQYSNLVNCYKDLVVGQDELFMCPIDTTALYGCAREIFETVDTTGIQLWVSIVYSTDTGNIVETSYLIQHDNITRLTALANICESIMIFDSRIRSSMHFHIASGERWFFPHAQLVKKEWFENHPTYDSSGSRIFFTPSRTTYSFAIAPFTKLL